MAEGLLISGRMLKDHMLGALIDGAPHQPCLAGWLYCPVCTATLYTNDRCELTVSRRHAACLTVPSQGPGCRAQPPPCSWYLSQHDGWQPRAPGCSVPPAWAVRLLLAVQAWMVPLTAARPRLPAAARPQARTTRPPLRCWGRAAAEVGAWPPCISAAASSSGSDVLLSVAGLPCGMSLRMHTCARAAAGCPGLHLEQPALSRSARRVGPALPSRSRAER